MIQLQLIKLHFLLIPVWEGWVEEWVFFFFFQSKTPTSISLPHLAIYALQYYLASCCSYIRSNSMLHSHQIWSFRGYTSKNLVSCIESFPSPYFPLSATPFQHLLTAEVSVSQIDVQSSCIMRFRLHCILGVLRCDKICHYVSLRTFIYLCLVRVVFMVSISETLGDLYTK